MWLLRHVLWEELDFPVAVKFNIQILKGNINDDVNLYLSYVS